DLWTLDMETRKATLFLRTEFNEHMGQFSPDGRWMAYVSDESRSFQVYVRSFPVSGGKWQVSVGGGTEPRWRRDGKELYFVTPDKKVMAVPVKLGRRSKRGRRRSCSFRGLPHRSAWPTDYNYAVTGDGQRFLINSTIADARQDQITVVVSW